MVRKYPWAYRRSFPGEFPLVCSICSNKRRFKTDKDLENHNSMTQRHSPGFVKSRRRRQKKSSIQGSIDTHVLPTESNRRECNSIVKRVGNVMRNSAPTTFRPSEVIKAGSTGKGTAVRGSSDVDVVTLLPKGLSTINSMHRNKIFDGISDTLQSSGFNVTGRSTKAIQMRIPCNESGTGRKHNIDVDVVPTANLDHYSRQEIYRRMKKCSPEERKFFTPSLTKWQRDFVKERPEQLKRLIRHVKDWKDRTVLNQPTSYAFELLIIKQWQNNRSPETFKIENALRNIMEELSSYQRIRVEFVGDFYDYSMKQSHTAPYIIDPVNPYSNIMDGACNWPEVASKASEYLQREDMRGARSGFVK